MGTSTSIIALLILYVPCTLAHVPVASGEISSLDSTLDSIADKLVGGFVGRALKAERANHTLLENTAHGKQGRLHILPPTSRSTWPGSLPTRGGLALVTCDRTGGAAPSSQPIIGPSGLRIEPVTDRDLRVIKRQVPETVGGNFSKVAGCGARCRHGFAQAFAWDPLFQRGKGALSKRAQSLREKRGNLKVDGRLFHLSCPLLVGAIDAWEVEGAINDLNEELRASASATDGRNFTAAGARPSPGKSLAELLAEAHVDHAQARRELIGDRMPALVEDAAAAGEKAQAVMAMVLDTGIAGQTRSKLDVKCVHAQLADHFCRSESNGVAAYLLQRLEERGAEVRGSDDCFVRCDISVPEDEARERWWYETSTTNMHRRRGRFRSKAGRQRRRSSESVDEEASGDSAATASTVSSSVPVAHRRRRTIATEDATPSISTISPSS